MTIDSNKSGIHWRLFVLTGLSLSIKWGIRGNGDGFALQEGEIEAALS